MHSDESGSFCSSRNERAALGMESRAPDIRVKGAEGSGAGGQELATVLGPGPDRRRRGARPRGRRRAGSRAIGGREAAAELQALHLGDGPGRRGV
eukprot:gene13963-biopygen12539